MKLQKLCSLVLLATAAACGGSSSGGNTATGTILGTTFTPLGAVSEPGRVEMFNYAVSCSGGTGSTPAEPEDLIFTWSDESQLPAVGGYEVSNAGQQNDVIVLFDSAAPSQAPQSGTVTVTSSSASLVEGTFNLTFVDNDTGLTTTLSGSFSAPNCANP